MNYEELYILYNIKLVFKNIDLKKELKRLEEEEKFEECIVVRDIINQMRLARKTKVEVKK